MGRDLDEWHKRVEYHANNLNRFFSVSLETQEVRDIAYSVSTWTWARPALNHAPEVQAARGRRSGQSRRDANAGRNLTIRDLKDDDWTVEDIAAIIGIHRSTVYRVMKSASRYLDTNRVNVARTCQGGQLPGMQSQPPTLIRSAQPASSGAAGAGKGKGGAERVLTVQRLVEKVESVREDGMDKNLVVSLDEIKGIRLQCKECGSEVVVSPTNPYLYGHTCPQGQLWQEKPLGPNDDIINTFLGALKQLIESPAPFKAVRLEIDGGQVEESDAEGSDE